MSFWLKKVVSFWLMPLPLCLALLGIGVLLLLIAAARGRRSSGPGLTLATLGALLLLFFSNRGVSVRLVRPLEALYPPIPGFEDARALPPDLASCRFIVVLGSGHGELKGASATNRLVPAGLARLTEAVRLSRLLPGARLILSGPGRPGCMSHAQVLAAAAAEMGVDPSRLTLVDYARDTFEESRAVLALARGARVALVTSAWHMPRAAALFRRTGVSILPCPVDYGARSDTDFGWQEALGWDAESLDRSTEAVHERLGLLWERMRGQI